MQFSFNKFKKIIYISILIVLILVIAILLLNKDLSHDFELKWSIYINGEQSDVITLNDSLKEEQFNLVIKSEIDQTLKYSIELYGLQKNHIIQLSNQKEKRYISYEFNEENNSLNIIYNNDKVTFNLSEDDFQHVNDYYMLKDKENILIKNKNYESILSFSISKDNKIKVIFENILQLNANRQYEDNYLLNIISNDDNLLQGNIKVYMLFNKVNL